MYTQVFFFCDFYRPLRSIGEGNVFSLSTPGGGPKVGILPARVRTGVPQSRYPPSKVGTPPSQVRTGGIPQGRYPLAKGRYSPAKVGTAYPRNRICLDRFCRGQYASHGFPQKDFLVYFQFYLRFICVCACFIIAGSLESAYWLLRGGIVFWEILEEILWQFYDK